MTSKRKKRTTPKQSFQGDDVISQNVSTEFISAEATSSNEKDELEDDGFATVEVDDEKDDDDFESFLE